MSKPWQISLVASVLFHAAVFAALPLTTHWLAREKLDSVPGAELVSFQLLDDPLALDEASISELVASTVPAQMPVLTASGPTREPESTHPPEPALLPPPERKQAQPIAFEPAPVVQAPDKPISVNATEVRAAPTVTQAALAANSLDPQPGGVPGTNLRPREANGATSTLPMTGTGETFVEAQPRYRMNPPPAYPAAARRRNQQGVVLVTASITARGTVADAQVMKSSGSELLDESALKAVHQWQFQPARRGSTTVMSTVEIPVKFQLTR